MKTKKKSRKKVPMPIKLEGRGRVKALVVGPLVGELFCGFPFPLKRRNNKSMFIVHSYFFFVIHLIHKLLSLKSIFCIEGSLVGFAIDLNWWRSMVLI